MFEYERQQVAHWWLERKKHKKKKNTFVNVFKKVIFVSYWLDAQIRWRP